LNFLACFQDLDIKLKWPNDIIANGTTKIGGLVINSAIHSSHAVCNIGVGVNLSNSNPTLCLNDLIKEYNTRHNKTLPLLSYERTFALIFNEIEMLLKRTQTGDFDHLYELYYTYWLHTNAEVTIATASGAERTGKITGIDDYGYLLVNIDGVLEAVQPDGNSFDMLRGLIAPKVN
jgi:biotin---protein ligase